MRVFVPILALALASSVWSQEVEVAPRRDVILSDRAHFHTRMSPTGNLQVAELYRLVGITFEGAAADTHFWNYTTSGAGAAATQSAGIATLSSGTANSGYGQLQSVQTARFMFAHPMLWRGAILVTDTTVAESTRRWGAFTSTAEVPADGHYFELDEAGVLSVVTVKGDAVVVSIPSGSFNGDVKARSYAVDTNVHAYEILYYTMGAWFFIDDVLIHECLPTTASFTETLSTPITITAVNSGSGTTSATIESWNTSIVRLGRATTEPTSYYHAVGQEAGHVLKRSPGMLHDIVLGAVSNNAVVTIYDSVTASGTVLWTSGALPANANIVHVVFDLPFFTGATLAVTDANASVVVAYE